MKLHPSPVAVPLWPDQCAYSSSVSPRLAVHAPSRTWNGFGFTVVLSSHFSLPGLLQLSSKMRSIATACNWNPCELDHLTAFSNLMVPGRQAPIPGGHTCLKRLTSQVVSHSFGCRGRVSRISQGRSYAFHMRRDRHDLQIKRATRKIWSRRVMGKGWRHRWGWYFFIIFN